MKLPQRVLLRYQEEIEKIRVLDDATFQDLVSTFEDAPRTVNTNTLTQHVASKIKAVPQSDIEEIVPALLSLCTLRDQFDSSTSEAAEDIAREVEASEEDRQRLRDRLTLLLDLDLLNVVAKSTVLLINHQRFMREAQILTDIRPIFGARAEDPPTAAVLVHTLKVSYFENNEFKDFFVALDAEDVRRLRELLVRAEEKAGSLRSVLEAANVPRVDAG